MANSKDSNRSTKFLGFHELLSQVYTQVCSDSKTHNQLVLGENANKKKSQVEWSEECQQAFEQLKQLCSQTPILAYANYNKPFKLHTDASENGLGAVLYQKQDDGTDHVIAYASQTLLKSERNYDAINWSF